MTIKLSYPSHLGVGHRDGQVAQPMEWGAGDCMDDGYSSPVEAGQGFNLDEDTRASLDEQVGGSVLAATHPYEALTNPPASCLCWRAIYRM